MPRCRAHVSRCRARVRRACAPHARAGRPRSQRAARPLATAAARSSGRGCERKHGRHRVQPCQGPGMRVTCTRDGWHCRAWRSHSTPHAGRALTAAGCMRASGQGARQRCPWPPAARPAARGGGSVRHPVRAMASAWRRSDADARGTHQLLELAALVRGHGVCWRMQGAWGCRRCTQLKGGWVSAAALREVQCKGTRTAARHATWRRAPARRARPTAAAAPGHRTVAAADVLAADEHLGHGLAADDVHHAGLELGAVSCRCCVGARGRGTG